ncbi:MAG: magnesium transporter CorA family protein [Spirochaetaceae bacterium]|nr:magnesium transporter CorA family protein [Spirochaetaceae bacterium]
MIYTKSLKIAGIKRDWYHIIEPSENELAGLSNQYNLDIELLKDVMNPDELSHFELIEQGIFIIARLATHSPHSRLNYNVVPLGIILVQDKILTVCSKEVSVFDEHFRGPILNTDSELAFILSIMLRNSYEYLHFLKGLKKQIDDIEKTLHQTHSGNEIVGILPINKSLQYYITALQSNDGLMEKLKRSRYWVWSEDEVSLLNDINVENKEATEIATIYVRLLKTLIDVFGIVINNDLNSIMKKLASLALLIAIPTSIASIYGMNVDLPMEHYGLAFPILMGIALSLTGIAIFILRKRKYF